MESKQQTTLPFWTSTCGGGCAKRHSSSDRVQRRRTCSRHTSSVSQRESFPPAAANDVGTAAIDGDVTDDADDDVIDTACCCG
jgi:hypothetical protein